MTTDIENGNRYKKSCFMLRIYYHVGVLIQLMARANYSSSHFCVFYLLEI